MDAHTCLRTECEYVHKHKQQTAVHLTATGVRNNKDFQFSPYRTFKLENMRNCLNYLARGDHKIGSSYPLKPVNLRRVKESHTWQFLAESS